MDFFNFLTRLDDKRGQFSRDSSSIDDFIHNLQESLRTNRIVGNTKGLQNAWDKLLDQFDKTKDYNVVSYTNSHTLLSYEDNGIKCIKVPNSTLPCEPNSRKVFNYSDGKFSLDERDTRIKDVEWEKLQINAKEFKEGTTYLVEYVGDGREVLLDLNTGKSFQTENVNENTCIEIKAGDFVIAKDGRYFPYYGEINITSEEIKKEVDLIKQYVENRNKENKYEANSYLEEKAFKASNKPSLVNLPEDSTYVMLDFTEEELYLQNTKTGDSIYVDKEGYDNYEIGDFLIVKDSKLTVYDGIIEIGSDAILKSVKRLYDEDVSL